MKDENREQQVLKTRFGLIILVGVWLLGCSTSAPVSSKPELDKGSQQMSSANLGQSLPIGAQATMGSEVIELEVAQTPQQQEIGLMYRTSLANNRGMLFPFESPRYTRFWMKNTVIPLDIIFLKDGQIIAIFSDVPPCQTDPCASYGPQSQIDQVIELRGGRATELGLKVGDRITVEFRQ